MIRNEVREFIRARAQRISARMQPREAEAISLNERHTFSLSIIKDVQLNSDKKAK